jgi:hypothetical protein
MDEQARDSRSSETGTDPVLREAFAGLSGDFDRFIQAYEENIRPALQEREAERAAAAKRSIQSWWTGGTVIAVSVITAVFIFREPAIAILGGLAGMGLIGWGSLPLNRLSREAKALLVEPVARELGLDYAAKPGNVPSIHRHRELRLVPGWDRANFEDRLAGMRREVNFEMFEAHLEERRTTTDSKGRTQTTWVTVFRGQCLKLDFHKTFYGRTRIAREAGFFNRLNTSREMQRAKLEDPEFERAFAVFTTDQVEARYLLTPDLMQRLVDLERAFRGGRLQACFDGGEMLITLQGGDLFEPGTMYRPLDDPRRTRDLLNDFAAVFNIIDTVTACRIRLEAEQPSRRTDEGNSGA